MSGRAFVHELDLGALGCEGIDPAATGLPTYHPAILLKIYIYGYLNKSQSNRQLEHEAEQNDLANLLRPPVESTVQSGLNRGATADRR